MEILYWKINSDLKIAIKENYRTDFAIKLKDADILSITRELTFDGVAPHITFNDIESLLSYINKYFLNSKIGGIGLEVGAGCGTFSSILAKYKSVKKIYALEICEEIVKFLMPKVAKGILGNDESKMVGCIGDFNSIELPESSIDFVFDFFSLHHSDDLNKTIKEIYRILKPGGFIFCFDKARSDSLTDQDIKKMLDKEYGDEFKKRFGIPLNKRLTREMNGEREYRLWEWNKAFSENGFSKFDHFNIVKCMSNNPLIGFVKKYFFSVLPPSIQLNITRFIHSAKTPNLFSISDKNKIYSRLVNSFPKEISLLIAHK